ncbi:hypothetical protein [Intrasporangium flavum]|uniref:hypothetical protein n=1 Tax=Intrasporangium flavum TaxID=1428657 RepID=UPI00096F8E05|nr:hypothetical protein [Intrasporangium flavum]
MKKLLAVAVAAAGIVLSSAVPAMAAPRPPAASDADLKCSYWWTDPGSTNFVYSCYDRKYDNFWVYDGVKDGNSAVVRWSTQTGGSGSCRNAQGVGTWQRCSYDLAEYKADGTRNHVTWDEYRYDSAYDSWQLVTAPAGTSVT